MRQDYLVLKNLIKKFGSGKDSVFAVNDIDLTVREGELVTLLGPSGCGKTTTLRMIAGFELPTSGEILIDGEEVSTTPPNRRPTTMVFQNYALFPHMTVAENIAYGLKIQKENAVNARERAETAMQLVGLEGLGGRSPAQLSGGQQQRVSLARSLVMEPKVLLLDEPLSNLDAKLRVSTRLEIRNLQQRVGITTVYVTHDQEEAMSLSDRVVIMHEGIIKQIGTPQEVYAYPVNRFVADFIGKANFLEGVLQKLESEHHVVVDILGNPFQVSVREASFAQGDKVLVVVRPESVVLEPRKPDSLIGTIQEAVYLGSQMVYVVETSKHILTVEVANPLEHITFSPGEEVTVTFQEKSLHILPYEKM